MAELKFVIKCLLFTCLLFAVSQYKIDDEITVEASLHNFLISAPLANFVNESARGGVKLFHRFVSEGTDLVNGYFHPNQKSSKVKAEKQEQRQSYYKNLGDENSSPKTQNEIIDLVE